MNDSIFYAIGKTRRGPVSIDDLRILVAKGVAGGDAKMAARCSHPGDIRGDAAGFGFCPLFSVRFPAGNRLGPAGYRKHRARF